MALLDRRGAPGREILVLASHVLGKDLLAAGSVASLLLVTYAVER